MKNSCRKGKTGERAAAKFLTSIGFPAIRGQQHRGGNDSPDVRVPTLPNVVIEVKYGGRAYINFGATLDAALAQANRDAGAKDSCVLWYQTGGIRRWLLSYTDENGYEVTRHDRLAIAAHLNDMNDLGVVP